MKPNMKFPPQSIARCLLIVAALLGSYLAWQSLGASAVAGCAEGSSCDTVLSSGWSKVFGLPVALLGVVIYVSAAWLGVARGKFAPARLLLLLLIPGAAVWFFGVQAFAIGKFCPWCCATHLIATAGAILLMVASRVTLSNQWFVGVSGAAAALAVLAGVQIAQQSGGGAANSVVSAFEFDGAADRKTEYLTEVSLLDGKVVFDLEEMPLVGVSQPREVIVALTDYTCSHCRKLHDVLQEVGVELGGEVAILKLPATRKGTDSADIHHHMLALWKISPKMHWTLERDLIEGRVPASAAAVRAEVIRLVGANQFAEASVRHNEWIGEQIANTRKVQDANRETTGKGTLPQVIVGSELVMGAHADPEYYLGLVEKQFGLVAKRDKQKSEPRLVRRALELEDGVVHLGAVQPGTTVPFRVAFTNQDREPLEIAWLNMGANITLDGFTRDEIDPDQKAQVGLFLNVPEDARQRQITRSVTIHTKTGHAPVSFRVIATVGTTIAQVQPAAGAE